MKMLKYMSALAVILLCAHTLQAARTAQGASKLNNLMKRARDEDKPENLRSIRREISNLTNAGDVKPQLQEIDQKIAVQEKINASIAQTRRAQIGQGIAQGSLEMSQKRLEQAEENLRKANEDLAAAKKREKAREAEAAKIREELEAKAGALSAEATSTAKDDTEKQAVKKAAEREEKLRAYMTPEALAEEKANLERAERIKTADEKNVKNIEDWVDAANKLKDSIQLTTKEEVEKAIADFNALNAKYGITDPYKELYKKAFLFNLGTVTPKMETSRNLWFEIYYMIADAAKKNSAANYNDLPKWGEAGEQQRVEKEEKAQEEKAKKETEERNARIEKWVDDANALLTAIKQENALNTPDKLNKAIERFNTLNQNAKIKDPYEDLFSSWSLINFSVTAKMRLSRSLYLEIQQLLETAKAAIQKNDTSATITGFWQQKSGGPTAVTWSNLSEESAQRRAAAAAQAQAADAAKKAADAIVKTESYLDESAQESAKKAEEEAENERKLEEARQQAIL